jgi:hypothetical protein
VLLLLSPAGRLAAASCVISHQDKITLAGEFWPQINYPSPTTSAVLAKLIFTRSRLPANLWRMHARNLCAAFTSMFRSFSERGLCQKLPAK